MVIPGFSAYDISEDGVVTHLATGREVKQYCVTPDSFHRYIRVGLIDDDGNRHACNVLRLLALTYLEKPSEPCVARALDGDNLNVKLSNVAWEPYATSTKFAWKSGRYATRKHKPSLCCTQDSVDMVLNALEQLDQPVTIAELSRILDVPYSTARYSLMYLRDIGKAKGIKGKGYVIA